MNILNGKIIYDGADVYINGTTYNAQFTEGEYKIVTTGSSTIVLPLIDGSKCRYHIYVKSGSCQVTGTVDGSSNPLLLAQELEYDIVCDGTTYYFAATEKFGFEVATKSKVSTIQSYNQSGVIAINTILMTIDCADANSISLSCRSMGTTGVVTPRWRNEVGETGQGATIVNPAGTSVTTFNAVGMWTTPVFARYLDLVLTTATTAGTTTITATKLFGQTPIQLIPPIGTQPISGSVTATVASTTVTSISAGTNAIGDLGLQYRTNATGAASRLHIVSAATTNPTIVKASAGRVIGWSVINTNAAWRYVKLHNQATSPTAGTGVAQTIGVPPNSVREMSIEGGIAFTTGIALTTVTGAADSDATAVGLNDLVIDIFFA